MKLTLLLITAALSLSATTLPTIPVLSPDSISIDPASPGLGLAVHSTPGSTWQVWFNDNYGNDTPGHNGDFDYNDAVATIAFGSLLPSGLVPVTVQYLASASAHDNDLHVSAGGNWLDPGDVESFFFPGSHVYTIMMRDNNTHETYRSGSGSLNPDGIAHAWVSTDAGGQVPEPTSVLLMGAGLVVLGGVRRRVRK